MLNILTILKVWDLKEGYIQVIKVSLYSSMEGVKVRHNLARNTATTTAYCMHSHTTKKVYVSFLSVINVHLPLALCASRVQKRPKYTGSARLIASAYTELFISARQQLEQLFNPSIPSSLHLHPISLSSHHFIPSLSHLIHHPLHPHTLHLILLSSPLHLLVLPSPRPSSPSPLHPRLHPSISLSSHHFIPSSFHPHPYTSSSFHPLILTTHPSIPPSLYPPITSPLIFPFN